MLTSKEILISYINTLSDKDCKAIYFWAKEELNISKKDFLWFNIDGVQTNNADGIVKLTQTQYNKLIFMFGEEKTIGCIKILAEWLLEKDRRHLKASHYQMLNGWVERYYHKLLKEQSKDLEEAINFAEINSIEKAIEYINNMPEETRDTDPYCQYLVNRFNIIK